MFSHKLLLLANRTSHWCEMHITPLSLCYSYTRSVMHGVNEMLVVVYICLARHMYKPEWVYGIYTIIRVVPLLYTHTGESIRHSLLPWICGESFVFLGGGLVIHWYKNHHYLNIHSRNSTWMEVWEEWHMWKVNFLVSHRPPNLNYHWTVDCQRNPPIIKLSPLVMRRYSKKLPLFLVTVHYKEILPCITWLWVTNHTKSPKLAKELNYW